MRQTHNRIPTSSSPETEVEVVDKDPLCDGPKSTADLGEIVVGKHNHGGREIYNPKTENYGLMYMSKEKCRVHLPAKCSTTIRPPGLLPPSFVVDCPPAMVASSVWKECSGIIQQKSDTECECVIYANPPYAKPIACPE